MPTVAFIVTGDSSVGRAVDCNLADIHRSCVQITLTGDYPLTSIYFANRLSWPAIYMSHLYERLTKCIQLK